jgi:hypothetical protein
MLPCSLYREHSYEPVTDHSGNLIPNYSTLHSSMGGWGSETVGLGTDEKSRGEVDHGPDHSRSVLNPSKIVGATDPDGGVNAIDLPIPALSAQCHRCYRHRSSQPIPTMPIDATDPDNASDAIDTANSGNPNNAIDATDASDAIDAIHAINLANPGNAIAAIDAIDPADPVSTLLDPSNIFGATDPDNPGNAIDAIDLANPGDTSHAIDATDPGNVSVAIEATDAIVCQHEVNINLPLTDGSCLS